MKRRKMPLPDGHGLTAALTDITAAWVDHPAATSIDHLKAAAVIGNITIAVRLYFLSIRLMNTGFVFGHGESSLAYIAAPACRGHRVVWIIAGHLATTAGWNAGTVVADDWREPGITPQR
jgi:hypothetical protein